MSQRLFAVPKVPLFLDAYVPGVEKRRGEETKILTLTLRVQPFDSKMAHSIDDGLHDDSGVKAALFKMNNGEPKPHLARINFNLGLPATKPDRLRLDRYGPVADVVPAGEDRRHVCPGPEGCQRLRVRVQGVLRARRTG